MFHDDRSMKDRPRDRSHPESGHHGRERSERDVSRTHGRKGRDFDPFTSGGRGRRERIFEQGDLKLVILDLIARKPSHGYELIKAIAEQVSDDYTPSPGVVYPTLMYLEESGMILVAQEADGKKQYAITPQGTLHLAEQQQELAVITRRIQGRKSRMDSTQIPELHRAMHNIRQILNLKIDSSSGDETKIKHIIKILDQAASDIGQL